MILATKLSSTNTTWWSTSGCTRVTNLISAKNVARSSPTRAPTVSTSTTGKHSKLQNIFSCVKYFLAASHIFCAGSPRASRVSRSLARVLGPAAARWRPRPPPARAPTWHQTRRDHCRWCPVSRPVPVSPGTKGHKLETRLPHCRQHWQLSPPGLVGMQPLVLSGLLSPRASLRSSHEISQ